MTDVISPGFNPPFPKLVINLNRDTERFKAFMARNGHAGSFLRHGATDGRLLNREELCKSGYIADNLSYGDGTLGCAMSHIYLWEKIAAGNIPMTIFEDDAILSYRFEQVSCNILNRLPMDWDIIHWGNIISPSFIWVDLGHTSARIEPYGPARNTDYGPARNTDNEQQLQIFSGRILTPQP